MTALSNPATLIDPPRSILERLVWTELFPVAQPIEVELGSGDGSFLVEHARRHPDRNFVGVERLLGRLRKLNRKGLRADLRNLRLIRLEAAYLVDYLLPPASVQALHLYFPDPWPKRKHRKHRLVNEPFVNPAEVPALQRWVASGEATLGHLLRDPDDRDDRLEVVPLLLLRDGDCVLAPDDDLVLAPDDELLLAGRPAARRALDTTMMLDAAGEYVVTGRQLPAGWLWRKLAARASASPPIG